MSGRGKGIKKILWLFPLIILFFPSLCFAAKDSFPSPIGYVNDFAHIIDPVTTSKINQAARYLEKRTSAELAIVTIPSVSPLDTKTYAVKIFEKWKLGKKGYDNGLLILLAQKEKRIEIEVGYGLEPILTDQYTGRVLDEYVIPKFKEQKFGEGLYAASSIIAKKIIKNYEPLPVQKKKSKNIVMYVIILFALIFLAVLLAGFTKYKEKMFKGMLGLIVGGLIGFVIAAIPGAILGAIIGAIGANSPDGHRFGGFLGGYGGFGGFGGFGGSGGGFGGFGGGGSGGGGAGRSW